MDILLPVFWVLIRVHVVQDQLKEDELLRDSTKRVVEAEHVVSILCFNAGQRAQGGTSSRVCVSKVRLRGHSCNLRVNPV